MSWTCSHDRGDTTKGDVDVSFPLLSFSQSKPDFEGGEDVHLLVRGVHGHILRGVSVRKELFAGVISCCCSGISETG